MSLFHSALVLLTLWMAYVVFNWREIAENVNNEKPTPLILQIILSSFKTLFKLGD